MAKLVLTSSVPVILIVNHGILSITTAALNGFGMKYLERQLGLTAREAGVQYGMITILGAFFGAIFGGWMHRKFSLQEKGTSWLILSCTIISVISLTPLYYLGKPSHQSSLEYTYFNLRLRDAKCHRPRNR